MNMELDYDTVLDVALGGPEIGPMNMVTLHGLLRELFEKTGLTDKQLVIDEDDLVFGSAYNFIKSKVDESKRTPRTAGGGYSLERSKVSVIVSDYAKSPIGKQSAQEEKPRTPAIIPADIEDRLKFIESELKIVKNFPSVDELRSWASEKTSPDTIVTDLWHFVSLNHRMNGAEEGIQKLTELVDKLIPELKKLNDEQSRYKGEIDDLYSQFKALSDRTTRTNERIDTAGEKAEQKLQDLLQELKEIDNKLDDYAKLNDLQDFVLHDTFVEGKEKAKLIADQLNEELATKAPLGLVSNLPSNGDLRSIKDEIKILRNELDNFPRKEDLSNLDIYVKWPQLEDAITTTPGSSRPTSSRPISGRSDSNIDLRNVIEESDIGRHPVSGRSDGGSGVGSRTASGKSDSSGNRPTSDRSSSSGTVGRPKRTSRGSRTQSFSEMVEKPLYQPSDNVMKRLNELGMLAERQNALMDALERTRERLDEKADKSDLQGFLNDESLNDLLNLMRNMREEMNGLQSWRAVVDDEKVPVLRDLLKELEEQVSTLLASMNMLNEEDQKQQKSIDLLFTYIDRLEENKLERDDPLFTKLTTRKSSEGDNSSKEDVLSKEDVIDGSKEDNLKMLSDAIKEVTEQLENHENKYKKDLSEIGDSLDDKLDRAELQPLREYLEHRYNVLSEQQQEAVDEEQSLDKHHSTPSKRPSPSTKYPTPPSKSRTPNYKHGTSPMSQQEIPPRINVAPNGYVEQLPCSHPHYGDGFVPHKDAALFRQQMKFNCLSCDRPLSMQTNGHFQTIRGRPLNAYELDQLRVLQRILKGDKLGNPTRSCGGKHTKLPADKKISSRVNSSKSLPVVESDLYVDEDLIDGEVDIEGLDGRLYKGLISQKDLKRHLRSKSASAQLRTVSPRMKGSKDRPISGKSVDFTSSFSSGLGTTHGSLDIHINQ